jgi:(2Fe-2S) ferredoxin
MTWMAIHLCESLRLGDLEFPSESICGNVCKVLSSERKLLKTILIIPALFLFERCCFLCSLMYYRSRTLFLDMGNGESIVDVLLQGNRYVTTGCSTYFQSHSSRRSSTVGQ